MKRNLWKWLGLGWSGLMVLWLIVGGNAASQVETTSEAEAAGAAIGTGIGIAVIVFVWIAGMVVLGILKWLFKRNES